MRASGGTAESMMLQPTHPSRRAPRRSAGRFSIAKGVRKCLPTMTRFWTHQRLGWYCRNRNVGALELFTQAIIGSYAASLTLTPSGRLWLFSWKGSWQSGHTKSTTFVPGLVGSSRPDAHAGQYI